MPKRIPHLDQAIVDTAARLFSRHGYESVDMKMVAAEAGTSVGNLYNYFPSKPALFLAIKERWRHEVLAACRTVLASDAPRRDKILTILNRLYDDITSWQGLWAEFLGGHKEREQFLKAKAEDPKGGFAAFGPEESEFLAEFEALLTGSQTPVHPQRWSSVLIMATVQMARRFPSDRAGNWRFLETLVDKI